MRRPLASVTFAGLCLCLTACASIVSKSEYPVTISSNPPGTAFAVKKPDGTLVANGVTPDTITLPSSFGYFERAKYDVTFTRKDSIQTIPLEAKINGWYFGNIIIPWGIVIGMVVVDPLTGAMWRMDKSVNANFI